MRLEKTTCSSFTAFAIAGALVFIGLACGESSVVNGVGDPSPPTTPESPANSTPDSGGKTILGNNGCMLTAPAVPTATNVVALVVDQGPVGTNELNPLYVTVKVCAPGSSTVCQTIDDVRVDTGSTGLRIFASQLNPAVAAGLKPALARGDAGPPTAECALFGSGDIWGAVKRADVHMGGEVAPNIPIQVIGDPDFPLANAVDDNGAAPDFTSECLTNDQKDAGLNISTPTRLGANGLLGVSSFVAGCDVSCEGNRCSTTCGKSYWGCDKHECQVVQLPTDILVNPIAFFARDSNGLIITLPSVPPEGCPRAWGTLTFGISTAANNALAASATVIPLVDGYISTTFNNTVLKKSFIDTGSNGNYFPAPSSLLPPCRGSAGFYCPKATANLKAVMSALTGPPLSVDVPFVVYPVENLLMEVSATPGLAGGMVDSFPNSFDWGLPFFFGRTVYVGFDYAKIGNYTGPLTAF